MKRALIIIAIILLIAAVVGVILLGDLMLNNYTQTGSVFGSSVDLSGGFWQDMGNIVGVIIPAFKPNNTPPEETVDIGNSIYTYELAWNDTYVLTIEKIAPTDGVLRFPTRHEGKLITVIAMSESVRKEDTYGVREIIIPDAVTKIGENAFEGMENLESVTLGTDVNTIGDYAFYGCPKLKTVHTNEKLTLIEPNAFTDCVSLEEFKFPEGLQRIWENAFKNCRSLKNV